MCIIKILKMETVKLISNDGCEFVVDVRAARGSITIRNLIEDVGFDQSIPIPNVNGKHLSQILEYLEMHKDNVADSVAVDSVAVDSSNEISEKDRDFLNRVCKDTPHFDGIFELLGQDCDVAPDGCIPGPAPYLDCQGLIDLCSAFLAELIRDKTPAKIRETFGVPEES